MSPITEANTITMQHNAKSQLYIILLIVLLGFIGNSISYPIFSPLFLHPAHGTIVPSTWEAQWRSLWLGITLMMYPLGQFVGSPILGALSDRYGRKIVLVISATIMSLFYLITAWSLTYNLLWLLILSRFLTGCVEGNISIARAMAIDINVVPKHKSLGLINAMSALGYIIGPLIGGGLANTQWVAWFNLSTPFYAMTIFSLFIVIICLFCLRESLVQPHHSGTTLVQQFNIIRRLKSLFKNRTLKIVFTTCTIASLSFDTFYEFYPAYMVNLLHATPFTIACYTAILSLAIGISCGWLAHFLTKYMTSPDVITWFLPISASAFVILIFLTSEWPILILFFIIGLVIGVTTTNYTVQVSESAASHLQGEVLGSLWGIRMLLDSIICLIGGGLLMFSYRLPFIFSALAAITSWVLYKKYIRKNNHTKTQNSEHQHYS